MIPWNHSNALAMSGFSPTIRIHFLDPPTVDQFVNECVRQLKSIGIHRSRFSKKVRNPYPKNPWLIIQNISHPFIKQGEHRQGLKFFGPLGPSPLSWGRDLHDAQYKVYEFYHEVLFKLKNLGFVFDGVWHDLHGRHPLLDDYSLLKEFLDWPDETFSVVDAGYRQPFLNWWDTETEATIHRGLADAAIEVFGVRTVGYSNARGVGGDFLTPNVYPKNADKNPLLCLYQLFERVVQHRLLGPTAVAFATPGVHCHPEISEKQHKYINGKLLTASRSMGCEVMWWNHKADRDDDCTFTMQTTLAPLDSRIPPLWGDARERCQDWLGVPEVLAEELQCEVPELLKKPGEKR